MKLTIKKQQMRNAAAALGFIVLSIGSLSAQIKVSGTVLDETGESIIGASVLEKGTTNGVVTDIDGNFAFTTQSDNATLVISFVGYATQELKAAPNMKVTLTEDSEILEDVVVVGYGVQKKSSVTGAISQVKAEDMKNRTVTNAQTALQGKTAGVQVVSAPAPGKSPSIRVRGISSNGSSEPLYVVDGVRLSDIGNLDPNDIESMEVLKDAASAAIYGAEAGNGVVLITTKKGKSGSRKISYEFQLASQKLNKIPDLLNGEEYINYMSESGVMARKTLEDYWTSRQSTNWIEEAFENSLQMKHNLSVSGGNDNGAYMLSLSYLDDDGVVKGGADTYKRIAATINANYKLTSWLNVGSTTNLAKFDRTEVESGEYGSGLISGALNMDPLTPTVYTGGALPSHVTTALAAGHTLLTDGDGNYYGISDIISGKTYNPFINRDHANTSFWGYNVSGSLYADITPFKDLVFTSRFGYNLNTFNGQDRQHPYYSNTENYLDYNQGSNQYSSTIYYQWENFANYMHSFEGGHNVNAMAGISFQKDDTNSQLLLAQPNGEGAYLKDDDNFFYPDFLSATATRKMSGQRLRTAKFSYFFRMGYDWKGRYMLQGTLRADAADTSKLPKENRWGYFPAVSAGWTVSEEPFWNGIRDTFNSLKLRASWGQNGSLATLNNFMYSTTIVNNAGYNYIPGAEPATTGNNDLKWETSEQLDFGVDGRLLNDRLTFSADYYIKKTKDLLVNGTVPTLSLGGTMSYINAGNVENKGWEFELGWRDRIGKDFEWGIRGNLSTLKNEVTYLDPSLSRIQGTTNDGFSTYPTYFEKGHAAYYFRGYVFEGVDKATGDPIFADLDGSGIGGDDGDLTDIGDAIPSVTYGVTLTASWKGLDLTVFGSGTAGNKNYLQMTSKDESKNNRLKSVFYDDRWTSDNPNGSRPRAGMNNLDKYLLSSAMVYSASYFRIKQIQIGYSLPKSLMHKTRLLSGIRIYASLDDFFTFNSYPGLDPEIAPLSSSGLGVDKGSYPGSKKVVFGINVDF